MSTLHYDSVRVSNANPMERLKALTVYMNRWVDEWPKPKYNFHDFFYKKYQHVIPGTVDYAKAIATHCFYCNAKLKRGDNNGNHPNRASIDHYLPQSKGKTERFVICCAQCNTNKGDVSPKNLVSKITKASLQGKIMWGFHGRKLQSIAEQIQKITNDMLYNIGPKIYYFKR
jgi:hypothetical protein